MRKYPKITVITPSFNQGEFIEETIKSVLGQNYPNLEYIIMDGGSTDDTLKILKKYQDKIKWFSEKDKGQTDAINKGLKIATGDILCYLNSDDCFTENSLFEVARFFDKSPDAFVVTGDCIIVDEKGQEINKAIRIYKKIYQFLPFSSYLLRIVNFINQPSTFWRKEVFKRVGFFDEKLRYNMDYEYWLRILQAGFKFYYLNKPLSFFRIHSLSKGGTQFKNQFTEDLQVIEKYFGKGIEYYLHKMHNLLILGVYSFIR